MSVTTSPTFQAIRVGAYPWRYVTRGSSRRGSGRYKPEAAAVGSLVGTRGGVGTAHIPRG